MTMEEKDAQWLVSLTSQVAILRLQVAVLHYALSTGTPIELVDRATQGLYARLNEGIPFLLPNKNDEFRKGVAIGIESFNTTVGVIDGLVAHADSPDE